MKTEIITFQNVANVGFGDVSLEKMKTLNYLKISWMFGLINLF